MQPAMRIIVMGNLLVCQQCDFGCAMLSWGIDSAASSVQLIMQCCHGEFDSAASNVLLVVQCCHGEFNSMPAMCHWLCNVVMGN